MLTVMQFRPTGPTKGIKRPKQINKKIGGQGEHTAAGSPMGGSGVGALSNLNANGSFKSPAAL